MFGIILSYVSGSTSDGTREWHYRAVRCEGKYRHTEPRFSKLEDASKEAERLSSLGYEA